MSSRMLLQDAEAGDSVVAKVALLDGDAPAAGQDASSGYLELYHWRLVQAMQSQIHSASLANDRLFGSPATPWTGNTDGSSGVHLPTESPLTRETAAHSAHSVPAWQSPSVADGATPFSGGGGSSHHLRATSSSRSLRGSSVNTPLASSASRGFIHTTYPPSAGTPLPALDEHHSHSVSELQHLDDEIAQMNHELGASAANDTPLPAAHDVYGVGGGRRSGSHSRVSAGEVSSAAREAPQVPATPAVTPAAGIAGLIGPESRRRILTGVSLRGLPLSPAMREAKERNEKVTDVEDRARRDVESAAKPKPKRATSERTWQDSLRKFALATPDTAAPPRPKRAATFVVEQRKSPMGEFEATPVAVTPAPLQALLHREQAADAPKPDVVEVAETPAGGEGVGVTVPPAAAARPARARHARVGSELIDYEHAAPAVEVFQDSTGPSPLGSPLHGSPPTAAPTATPPGDPEPAPHGPTPTPAPLNFMTPAREQPESPAPPPVAGNITPEELFPAHSQSAREASVDGDDRGSGVLDVVRPSVGALAHMTPRAARHEASLTCLQSALVCAGMADAIAGALARGGSHGLRGVWSSPTPPVSARQEQRLARQGLFRARQAVLYLGDALGVVSSFPPQMRDAQWSALRSELGAAATSLHQTVRRATAHYRAFHGSDPMRAARGAEFPDAARYADIALVRSLHAVAESPYAARSRSRSPVSDRMVPLASPSVPSSGYGQSPPRSDRGSLAPQDVAVMGYADLVTRLQRLQSRHRESPVQSAAGGAVDDVSPREEMARVLDESLLVGEIIRRSKGGKPARRPSKLGTNAPPPKSDSELARIPTLDPAGIEADASAPASLPPQPPSGAPEAQSRQGSFGFPALAASQATAEAARGSLTSQEEQMVEDAVALAMSLVRAIRVESSAKATREGAPTPEAAADGAARSPAFAVRRAGLPSKQASGSNKRGAGAWATDNLRRSPGPKWAPDERLPFDAVLSESEQARPPCARRIAGE
ncbi:unnamed protein product [Pedinophyceae sp. YPF-701]|nr:unnamed protein product [Pedinophyceae sp. YPF-701]